MNTINDNFSQLYKKYANSLYGFGMGMGISHDTCLDIIHDIFCKLIEKNMVFETESIKHYLFRSFINRYLDIQKSRKREISGDINKLPYTIDVSLEDINVEGYIIEQEEKEKLKKKVEFLMGMLTHRQRQAVYFRYMEEMEYEEIGKLLDMTAESVRKLVYRGLEKMRKHAGDIPILFLLTFLKKTVHKKFL